MPPPSEEPRHSNRLVDESSPYLRQHAHNPVDWYPWGEEAFAKARAEDKPVLLSVGYSACHWCHVMAHESFEDEATGALMNAEFVNIKVDREERPDVDDVYMNAVQLLTRHGGWPMTVFLTPDGEPFYGGTYFPPEDRHGMPAFRTILTMMAEAYRTERAKVVERARSIAEHVRKLGELESGAGDVVDGDLLASAYAEIAGAFDPNNGGFGAAPKFPSSMALSFCLRRLLAAGEREAKHIVNYSLERMATGGIHDHLGGGFHRYSVDERWLVPHFEKMLYDNALLARLYVEGWQAIGRSKNEDDEFRRTAEGILSYVRREMTGPGGGFYATQDADSEGVEGKFYVWGPDEIVDVLGAEDGELFCKVYDVTAHGNFEGANILNLPRTTGEWARDLKLEHDDVVRRLESSRERLRLAREERIKPALDDKVIVAWNGLMLSAMAYAACAFDSEVDRAAAVETGEFLWDNLRRDGRLLHVYKDGEARIGAYLDDVAGLGVGYTHLYEATFDERWIERARTLADTLLDEFEDREAGGFFYSAESAEKLIARSKNPYDNAVPGGNALALHLLLRLHALTGEERYESAATRALGCFKEMLTRAPQGFAHVLEAADAHLEGIKQVVIAGDPAAAATQELVRAAFASYDPNRVVALAPPGVEVPALAKLLDGKGLIDGAPAAYVCRRFTCGRPATTAAELAVQLGEGGNLRG